MIDAASADTVGWPHTCVPQSRQCRVWHVDANNPRCRNSREENLMADIWLVFRSRVLSLCDRCSDRVAFAERVLVHA